MFDAELLLYVTAQLLGPFVVGGVSITVLKSTTGQQEKVLWCRLPASKTPMALLFPH